MDHPQRAVAVRDRLADHAKAVDVRQAREFQILLLHLAPDRIGLLGAAKDIRLDLLALQLGADIGGDLMHHVTRFALQRQEPPHDRPARFGVQDLEGQILQLLAHPLHAHPARQRRVNLHRLTRLLRLLFHRHRLDRAHVVQTVGQLHQDHPQVLRHRHEQLAEVLRLLVLRRGQLQVGQLGDPVHQFGDLMPEQAIDLGIGGFGVLDRVVQKGGDDRRIIQILLGQNRGHRHRMREIGLARLAELPFMHLDAVIIGAADQGRVAPRVIVADKRDQVFDVDHARLALPGPETLGQLSPCASISARSSFSSFMSSCIGRSISPDIRSAI